MKTKKFNKKLALNKKTVANLDKNEMGVVYGGCVAGTTSCHTMPYWPWCKSIDLFDTVELC